MIYRKHLYSLFTTFPLFLFFLMLSGCASQVAEQNPGFDPSTVGDMRFALDPSEEFSTLVRQDVDMADRITDNLAEWGYVISSVDAVEQSHDLTALVGKVQRGPTPVGFSFTAGNSNPRALDYQTAVIVPITCFLSSRDEEDEITAELTMEFAGKKFRKYKDSEERLNELVAQLIDDVSTVCYNLLSGLNVPTHFAEQPADDSHVPAWAPAVSIETIEPGKPSTVISTPATTSNAASTPPQKSAETNNKRIKEDPRKRIIIRNQGSPVIFTFGHERK